MEKHKQIREQLELSIASGAYAPGARLPTELELCRQFGAARATVARALRALEDSGLIARRRGAGTFVRSSEATTATQRIGLLIPGIGEGEVFAPICASIAAHATQFGLRISWKQLPEVSPENKADAVRAMCRQYIDEGVDGLFYQPLELVSEKDDTNRCIMQLLRDAHIPVVLVDADVSYPQRSDLDLVGIDNFRAGVVLAEHLLSRGCRAPVFLHRPGSAATTRARGAGVLSVLAASGLPTKGRLIEAAPDDPTLVARLTAKLKADAVVCANDYTAACLMKTLQAAGVAIPGQIKLAGVDNLRYSRLLSVPLTTVAQPCRDIGVAALELMRFRIDQPAAAPRQLLLDAPLVERESTGC